jgi:hypothetical protein
MATTIDASTAGVGGLITTPDNSGVLNLQSGGSTKIAVTSAGAAVTGALTVNGNNIAPSKILQVVNGSLGAYFSTASSTMVDSGLSLSITPTSATSTILVTLNLHGVVGGYRGYGAGGYAGEFYNVVRGSTSILDTSNYADQGLNNGMPRLGWSGTVSYFPTVNGGGVPIQLIDNPATTSATTYKIQISTGLSGWTSPMVALYRTSSITLMEIAA